MNTTPATLPAAGRLSTGARFLVHAQTSGPPVGMYLTLQDARTIAADRWAIRIVEVDGDGFPVREHPVST